jgi:valyl-tRNA synthetase
MSASAGDQDAVRFLRKKSIKPVQAVGTDGRMLDIAGPLKGLRTKEARAKIIELIGEAGCLERQEKFMHSVPVCERSGDEIEYISMPEFYVKQVEFKAQMKGLARRMNFFSPKSRQIMLDWIESVSIDWPISRRRFYATEVPVWYCRKCGSMVIPPKGRYYKPWREDPPAGSEGLKKGRMECEKCGGKEFRGEERVFDTWFDSSISPLYILKYSREPRGFFAKNQPCSLRPQGKEIIRTWLYYTVLKDWLLTGKCIFKDVWINYHILDEKGRKMSKRLGNVIDPKDVLDKFGAEPFRLWAAIEGNLEKTDFHCSFERIDGAGKTLTKLWNVARFISMFPEPEAVPKKLCILDEWILSETEKLVRYAKERYERYDFHNPSTKLKNFLWEEFASHYVELVKQRAYNQQGLFSKEEEESARYTLHAVLKRMLLLLSPIVPLITYQLYMDLRGKDIHAEGFPAADAKAVRKKFPFATEDILRVNSMIWKSKKDRGLSLKAEVKSAVIPKEMKALEKDLVPTHSIRKLEYGDAITVDV